MTAARHDDGTSLRFTRQERMLLLRLVRQPQTLVSRAQLAAALVPDGAGTGERNIDYLINRLRRRLGDSARTPRFIATQYGEGYIWLPTAAHQDAVSAFLLIGPVHGLAGAPPALIDRLAQRLRARLGPGRAVLVRPRWRAGQASDSIRYSLDVSGYDEGPRVHLALVLREGAGGAMVSARRLDMPHRAGQAVLDAHAGTLIDDIWAHAALPADQTALPSERPLHVRMHDAGLLLADSTRSWRENEPRLRAAHAADPDNPTLMVLLALNQYTRLTQGLADAPGRPRSDAEWAAIGDEIEHLALAAQPGAEGNPMLQLGIAQVLLFIDRQHESRVAQLAEAAFLASTAFGAAFSMKGQIAANAGDVAAAIAFYDRALELAEPGSQLATYLRVLKIIVLLADGRRREVSAMIPDLHPGSLAALELFLVSPRARSLPQHLEAALETLSPETGQHLLLHLYRTAARHFRRRTHQRNVLLGLATHLARHHGSAAIPPRLAWVMQRRTA